jgi:predicted nucleic acid-binding protein
MDRLFLDAKVLFSAAYRPNTGLHEFWKLKNVTLCSSYYALEEARLNVADEIQRHSLSRLARSIQLYEAALRELPDGISLPDKDVPILLVAFQARATHLITGDVRHFGRYFGRKIEGLLIVSPAEYLRERRSRCQSALPAV